MVIQLDELKQLLLAIVEIGGALGVLYGWIVKPIKAIKEQNEQQSVDIKQLTDDVAYLQGDRLNQAHEHYINKGWCTGSKKRELERWYKAYKKAGHNHLADSYIDDIMNLPEDPPAN